jgi:hypothetical protein
MSIMECLISKELLNVDGLSIESIGKDEVEVREGNQR